MNFPIVAIVVLYSTCAGQDDAQGLWRQMGGITPRGYVCYRAAEPLVIDGKLNDAAWEAAPWTDHFVDIEGPTKPKPRFGTRAKMLWDGEHFYVGARLEEPHAWATLTEHDSVIFHDNDFEVFIDPNGDNHEYYEFEINALNTGWDLFLPKPYMDSGRADNSWEIPGLRTEVHIAGSLNDPSGRDEYWSVELAFPWTAFAEFAHVEIPPQDGDQWRVNFSRVQWKHVIAESEYRKVDGIREDNWVWSPQGIINMHRPERWGFVQFSTAEPGSVKFTPDGELATRDELMELYHRQRVYRQQHGRWAATLVELGYRSSLPLQLSGTDVGYRGTIRTSSGMQWHVQQDSRLWQEANRD